MEPVAVLDTQQPVRSAEPIPRSTLPTVVIKPTQGLILLRWREIWEYRELFFFLIWRDVKVRYKQTILGAAWAIIQPVMTMVIFSIFFGRLAGVSSDGFPYPIFAYAGLLPWQLFATALSTAANSLVASASMVQKVYFPRVVLPVSGVLASLVDFSIAMVVLIGLMVWYRVAPTMAVLLLPLFLLQALVCALGVGLWLAALNVRYRDIRHALPFVVQFWLFATPVAYPSSLLDEPWRTLYGLNPMVGVVEGFRWAFLGSEPPSSMIAFSAVVSLVLLVTGAIYFQSVERKFADVI
ncbi:MAG: ABC transporter permease [Chloroflexales bacterium]|nr:ABC transporter permease [Chloroflexales bacterium]